MYNIRTPLLVAVALYLDVPADLIREGLAAFTGVGRRFDVKGVINGITLIDDYGHHPSEIRATLEAARLCKFNRVLVLFQPHRFSRTLHMWDEFCRTFNNADVLVMTDIYAASEIPIPGISSEALTAAIREAGHKHVVYRSSMQDGIDYLLKEARPGDAILTIGRRKSALPNLGADRLASASFIGLHVAWNRRHHGYSAHQAPRIDSRTGANVG